MSSTLVDQQLSYQKIRPPASVLLQARAALPGNTVPRSHGHRTPGTGCYYSSPTRRRPGRWGSCRVYQPLLLTRRLGCCHTSANSPPAPAPGFPEMPGWLCSCSAAEPSVPQPGHHREDGCRRPESPPATPLDRKERKQGVTRDSLALSVHRG